MDPQFDWKRYIKQESKYYSKWGFHVSRMEEEYFSRCSGIKSERYVPFSIWKFYIYPYLNRDSYRLAYGDKNMFHRMLDIKSLNLDFEVKIVKPVVYNMAGQFYDEGNMPCSEDASINGLLQCKEDLIIKPTVWSYGGKGIKVIKCKDYSKSFFLDLFDEYRNDFSIQHIVKQHNDLASFNTSSVNTIRIATYRNLKGDIRVLYAVQRFGLGSGICDNASSGGGYCGILSDGSYMRVFHKRKSIKTYKLDKSVAIRVPRFADIKKAVCLLHRQLPWFGIIGWDMVVSSANEIILIEYNFCLGYNLPQSSLGPLFTQNELEELLDAVSSAKTTFQITNKIVHPSKKGYDYCY